MEVLYFPSKINSAIGSLCIFNFFCCDYRLRVLMKRKRAAPYNGQSHLWQPNTHLSLQYKLQMWCDHYTWESYRAVKKLTFYSPLPSGQATGLLIDRWTVCDIICTELAWKERTCNYCSLSLPPPWELLFFLSHQVKGKRALSLALSQTTFQSFYVPKSHTTLHIIKMCCFVVICLLYCKSRPFYSFKQLAENVNSSCPTSLCMLVC